MTPTLITTYLQSSYFAEQQLLVSRRSNAQRATDHDYMEAMLALKEFMMVHKPIKSLFITDLSFTITPDLQDWTNAHVMMPLAEGGAAPQRTAFLIPEQAYKQMLIEILALEQAVEETNKTNPIQYFEDEAKARNWLFS
jgi:hypothetical protein